jgi:hypothetical protein
MVVGGYAVAFHGFPRFTKDIDIFFEASLENVDRLRAALAAFGFDPADLPKQAFLDTGSMLTFGVAPARVDLLNEIDGVSYAEAKPNTVRGTYGSTEVVFIGRKELIRNKRATQRPRDAVDADELARGGDG